MLRSDRKLAHVLDAWRAAMLANPEAWGLAQPEAERFAARRLRMYSR
jgi:hypothetical protein